MDACLVRTTYGSRMDAERAARGLLGRAVCVHLEAVDSYYQWDGSVQEDSEILLEARCSPASVDAVQAALLADHPYDVPLMEIIDCRVAGPYAKWMDKQPP